MLITRTSIISGIERSIEMDVNPEALMKFNAGEGLIQDMLPNLTADEREFIMTGVTAEEWDEIFGDGDE